MEKDLRLKEYFLFTQHSLSTFENCPLKFKKRYLENLKWDSFPDESIKHSLEMGNDFHLLAYRYFMGIEDEANNLGRENGELAGWLESLKNSFKIVKDYKYFPEYKLRMSDSLIRLEANYDLIILKDNVLEVWDWKTHPGKPGTGSVKAKRSLRDSLQTLVYLFVLKEQARLVAGREISCENISMYYWQPDFPHILEEIKYGVKQHEEARNSIEARIGKITGYDYSMFDKALYGKHCKYCEFNWFCNNERIDFGAIEEVGDFLDAIEWESIEERY